VHHPHRPQDRIALARRRCSVFGGTRRVWSIMSYWSLAKRLIPNAINNWLIWTIRCLKNDQNTKRGNTRSFFSITYGKTSSGHVGSTQLGSSTPRDLLTRLDSFRLSLVCIDGSRTCWAVLWFVRGCEKMARWIVRGKRERFLQAWYPQIARKMGKMCNKGAYFE